MSSETFQTAAQAVTAVGLVLAALGGYGAYYFGSRIEKEKQRAAEVQQQKQEAAAAKTGVLQPKLAADTPILDPPNGVFPQLELGRSGSIFVFAGPQGAPLFKFAGENHITVLTRGGRVKVSATIRDQSGSVVAELVENEWKVNPHDSWDRNYSTDALEVRDRNGDVVLQVRALPDRIQFQAKLYDATGMGIAFGESDDPNNPGGIIEFARPPQRMLRMKIVPMFRYPSERHLGEYAAEPAV